MNADGDLDSMFWQNFPCHYQSGFADRDMSPVLDIPEGRGGHWGKNTDTPPHSVPACESQSEARTGDADQSEAGSLPHADLWNNFTLLTPAQATPPSLPQTANSPLGTVFSAGTTYFMLAKTSILSNAA